MEAIKSRAKELHGDCLAKEQFWELLQEGHGDMTLDDVDQVYGMLGEESADVDSVFDAMARFKGAEIKGWRLCFVYPADKFENDDSEDEGIKGLRRMSKESLQQELGQEIRGAGFKGAFSLSVQGFCVNMDCFSRSQAEALAQKLWECNRAKLIGFTLQRLEGSRVGTPEVLFGSGPHEDVEPSRPWRMSLEFAKEGGGAGIAQSLANMAQEQLEEAMWEEMRSWRLDFIATLSMKFVQQEGVAVLEFGCASRENAITLADKWWNCENSTVLLVGVKLSEGQEASEMLYSR